ncbi:bifunctional diaminohydroxyphosphoribosylaminopyrimidine deaminase/5-amino-6-(5-phosphoribosylamino)uracil reductase RibD [Altererythrobacter sp. ZODW24]|uniref:bifunctional diaminohydroxyphosphoribosylaminopyrimidine deaminase/5-amino-6-(5-phosphoribosylamino)uracil reductase RibD n=1 Tax=Altererythrobacter sp. ZODW24 TaxID=2185142 RepID=UPI001F07AD0D|nr:bifunctional diaminohydroxyphosphoribosylaminopyrimidine deaminase/5-amino-6-(5-phosphoribosylamino)uracil reductase RibD [Altererythrobacter sp. ZODW24]
MKQPSNDRRWLDAAARYAARGRPASAPNPAVAAIVVKDGKVVGRGWTKAGGRPHAEAVALEQAGEAAKGATLYTTLEPCAHPSERGPTCSNLIAETSIARVVIGVEDPDTRTSGDGITILDNAGVATTVLGGAASESSLAGYVKARRTGRPHVTLKLAISLDGKIALPDGSSRWITGEEARAHVHVQRARNEAILVGGETLRQDKPQLDVRLPGYEGRSPERWVLSRSDAPDGWKRLSSPDALSEMDGVQYLYVEGGAGAAAAFLTTNLVEELHIYRAPIIIGEGKSAIADIGLIDLADAHGRWRLADRRQLGSDLFEAYERN